MVTAAARERTIAVALHDVEPATFERCALIRDWLDDHGVERVTLLVIPAPDMHPFFDRSPQLAAWLLDRRDAGDAIAQHGFRHRQARPAGPGRQALAAWQGGQAAEFPGLDEAETHASLTAGRRLLELAGLDPRGFVAPAYAYTPALRSELRELFEWWATLLRLHAGKRGALTPAWGLATSGKLKRALSPTVLRAAGVTAGRTLRLDLHPADFAHPRHVQALEAVLRGSRARRAVTYDDLCS